MQREDEPQFEQVYDDHVWTVYGFIGYRVPSREEAEDLTQLTFERALRSWRKFDPSRGSPATWLIAIARNLVIDHFRRGGGTRVDSLDIDTGAHPPDLVSAGPEESLGPDPVLEQAIGRLSDRDRELIALRFGGDLTGPEIAEVTGLTLANVQQILSRSLRQLRSELEAAAGSGGERPGSEDAERGDREQRQAGSAARESQAP